MDFQGNQNLIENKEEKLLEPGVIIPQAPSRQAMSGENELILEVRNLTVSFGDDTVVDNLSFNLKKGENVAIMGPNGAGKTVLLKALLGILPYSGEIKWSEDAKISYVPQKILPEKNLPLSVEEFFKMKKAGREQAKEALASVGITDEKFPKKMIGTISSGQLQRVLVAWGLVGNPTVLLFDEPTAGIDIGGEETIFNLLNKIEKERNLSIILVTHDMSVVYGFADSVLCLNKKLICYGPPAEALGSEGLKQLYGEGVTFYKHEH